MANITRIKNNQITDSTITYTKLASGTLVGSVFNANLTLNSNVTVIGNLSVTGNTSTINSTNTLVNDPLVIFNNGYTGTPSYDIGIIANRNLQSLAPYGSVNMAWIWEETAQQWQAVATTETGTTTGAINNSGFANLRVGNAIVQTVTVSNSVSVGTSLSVTGTTNHVGAVTMTTATTGGLQAVAIGNVTPGTGAFTTGTFSSTLGVTGATTLTTATTGGLQAVAIGNVTPGTGAFTAGTFSSTLGVTGATTLTTATTGGLQAVAVGNVTPGTGNFTSLNATGTFTAATVNAATIGNIGSSLNGTGTNITGLTATNINGTVATANVSYYDVISTSTTNATFYPAFFDKTSGNGQNWVSSSLTYNASTGVLSATTFSGAGTFSTGTFSSTLGVTGATTLTTATTGGLQAVAIGNVTPGTGAFTTGTFNTATTGGLQAVAIGNVTPGTAVFTTATTGGLQAVAIGNVTPGTGAFTTLTGGSFQGIIGNATATTAFFTTANATNVYAATIGNVGTVLTGSLTGTSITGTVATANVSLYDNVATTSTNATFYPQLSSATSGNVATVVATGINVNPSTSTISALGFVGGSGAFTTLSATGATTITNGTASTSAGTGALVVTGGVGIGGNLYVAGNVYTTNIFGVTQDIITIQDPLVYLQALGNLSQYNYDIGFYSDYSAPGYRHTGLARSYQSNVWTFFSNVASEPDVAGINWNDVGIAYDTVKMGALLVANSTVASSTATGALQVSGGAGIIGSAYIGGGVQNTPIGNATPNTGAFTTLSATGASTLNTITGASFQGIIGNVAPAAGYFTTATATTVNAATIGNTGATLTGTLSTAAQPNVTSVGTLTGLTVSGTTALNTVTGASFQGIIGNVTPAAGTFTTLAATTLTLPAINGTVIGNVTPSSATFTTVSTGGLQAVAIGNVTPGTGAFTTLTTTGTIISSGNIVAAATTASTDNNTGSFIAKGGVGIAGNLNVGVFNQSLHHIKGNVLFGQGEPITSADTIVTFNLNNTSPIVSANAAIHLSGTQDRPAAYLADSIGGTNATSIYAGRRARGTAGSPSAVQIADALGSVSFKGYGATGYAGGTTIGSGLAVGAAENFTDSSQASYLVLNVVKTGTVSATPGIIIDGSANGNVVIPSTTPSANVATGALVVKGGIGVVGNIYGSADFNTIGVVYASAGNMTNGITLNGSTDTTTPGVGTLVINNGGGASISGNAYVGNNLYIGASAMTKNLTAPTIIAVDNGTAYAQMAMMNSAGSGSADLVAYSANGNDAGGWADMGIAGNTFSDPNYTITNSQDGYFFVRPTSYLAGGNLVLATSEAGSFNDLVIAAGSFYSNAEVARFHGNASNSGTFVVKLPTPNTATANTGAFQVWGGASISGNSYTGGGAIINGGQTAGYDFKAMGKNSTNLLWARPSATYDQVVVGNTISAASLTGGAKLQINSTDSMLLPTGTTAQRPSSTGFTDVAGMFRFNTTVGAIEFYSGSSWQSVSTSFTVITDEQFNGDGTTVAYTMLASSTTAATIVSINGVVQIPTLAYSVSGTTLTFTEAPATGDVIDVRRLTTTQTVQNIASTNGYMQFQVDNNGAYVYTGSAGTAATTYWDTSGAQVGALGNVTASTANTATTIDTWSTGTYRTAKYVVQATNGSNFQAQEALVVHNGTTATIVSYAVLQTGSNLGVMTATITSGNVLVQFVPAISSTTVRLTKDYMTI